MRKKRWLIALAGVEIHISIGSVYAWGVFTGPLQESIAWPLSDVSFTFSLAISLLIRVAIKKLKGNAPQMRESSQTIQDKPQTAE